VGTTNVVSKTNNLVSKLIFTKKSPGKAPKLPEVYHENPMAWGTIMLRNSVVLGFIRFG
jgi:hypothetical protein